MSQLRVMTVEREETGRACHAPASGPLTTGRYLDLLKFCQNVKDHRRFFAEAGFEASLHLMSQTTCRLRNPSNNTDRVSCSASIDWLFDAR